MLKEIPDGTRFSTLLENNKLTKLMELCERADVQPGFPDEDPKTGYFKNGKEYRDKECTAPTTWCNRMLYYALKVLELPTEALLNEKGIGWTSANSMCANLERRYTEVEVDKITADLLKGRVLIAAYKNPDPNKSGHVGLVVGTSHNEGNSEIVVFEAGSEVGFHSWSKSNFVKGGISSSTRFFLC